MKIGIFGGTFDPPHLAHQHLVKTVLENGLFDQVWYVPVAIHQSSFAATKSEMTPVEDRLALLKLIQIPKTRIETFEIDSHQPSYTHHTLRALSKKYPEHTFSFLMGSDQLPKLHLWRCPEDEHCFPAAADEFEYRVYPRTGYPTQPLPYPNLKVIKEVEPMPDSSTEIRRRVAVGESILDLVDPAVDAYIRTHNLYQ